MIELKKKNPTQMTTILICGLNEESGACCNGDGRHAHHDEHLAFHVDDGFRSRDDEAHGREREEREGLDFVAVIQENVNVIMKFAEGR